MIGYHPARALPLARPRIEPLTPADVPRLRLEPGAAQEMARRLAVYPGRSVWDPETLEYVLLGPWRHRPDIAQIQEVAPGPHAGGLVREAIRRSAAMGDALVLLIELDERRSAHFHLDAGLVPLQQVITYELEAGRVPPTRSPAPRFEPAAPARASDLAALLRIDHASFPWLWWNGAEEFAAYAAQPGVRLYLGYAGRRPVAYVGVTTFLGWGHLDRIAVLPDEQGHGFGRAALAFAVEALRQQGVRRIGLSTQRDNERSRRLYESFGFRRSPGHDYTLYGAALRPPAPGLELRAEIGSGAATAECND